MSLEKLQPGNMSEDLKIIQANEIEMATRHIDTTLMDDFPRPGALKAAQKSFNAAINSADLLTEEEITAAVDFDMPPSAK